MIQVQTDKTHLIFGKAGVKLKAKRGKRERRRKKKYHPSSVVAPPCTRV